ncbi:MAG: Gfo/Idh/MocA family oxidoreductase [Tissierellaceae bacterium]
MQKLKFGIIGCGRISTRHIDAIINNKDDAELVAVYDVVEDLSVDKKNYYEERIKDGNVIVYKNYEDFLKDENIDIVAIASISGYHAQHALDSLNNNKHVLIEKPIALSIEDTDRIIELAKEKNKKVGVAHVNRFMPPIQKLRRALEEGRFGKLIHGSARTLWARDDNYYKVAPWRGTKEFDGGVLMNQCLHNIDLLQWMLGPNIERQASELDTFIRDIETEDFGVILMRFKDGPIGIAEGSVCVYPKNLEESLSILGEKGTVVIKNRKIDTWIFEDERDYDFIEEKEEDIGHTALYKDYIKAIREDREPYVNGEEGKRVVELILKAYGG